MPAPPESGLASGPETSDGEVDGAAKVPSFGICAGGHGGQAISADHYRSAFGRTGLDHVEAPPEQDRGNSGDRFPDTRPDVWPFWPERSPCEAPAFPQLQRNGIGPSDSFPVNRSQALKRFLSGAGWQDAELRPLAGDASLRSYLRLVRPSDGSSRVLMDAPVETCGPLTPFIRATRFFETAGLSAPAIHCADEGSGFLLLEDLGDGLVSRVIADRPELEVGIYEVAIDLLVGLLAQEPGPEFPEYTADAQSEIAADALWWYHYGATGEAPAEVTVGEFRRAIGDTVSTLDTGLVFVHRDYHTENLIWLPDRTGVRRLGVVDHQDGSLGHPSYDLVSILEDARRDIPAELREGLIRRYVRASGRCEDGLRRELAISGAQRNLRILGVFARLALRDGKPGYIDLMPRVWGHLERDLSHPAVSAISQLVERHLPPPRAALLDRIRGMVR